MGLLKFSPNSWMKVENILNKDKNLISTIDMTSLLALLLKAGQPIRVFAIEDEWYEFDAIQDFFEAS